MNAQEFRIGNWVQTSKPEKVCDVMCDSIATEESGVHLLDDIEPIPLTEKWFKKFGFIYTSKQVSLNVGGELFFYAKKMENKTRVVLWRGSGIHIDHWTLEAIVTNWDAIHYIQYVHQLQNLYFALTGKELEIK